MNTQLLFEDKELLFSSFGPEASVPDLLPMDNLQNKTMFSLDETDEIYESYGKRRTAYPYRQRNCYNHAVAPTVVRCAVLENHLLRAEFLPEYGGRLWRLYDKVTQRELLYTNDVLRGSNLAVRNAWFSGGVEWNIGVIGHTPLTCEPLFTAQLETPEGAPVLRMYEYERIRGCVYQMDFWLDEHVPALYTAMRITNPTAAVVPMYWWSNMAVPEYENGRIVTPATEAFTSDVTSVRKVAVPMVNGVDISRYNQIPVQVDYFFHIPQEQPKFIANVDANGVGLLHASTDRLQSRKLFSWGNNDASARWQEFLTQDAGTYLEIQAGLGKTQYGCLPMAPHTVWDWVELYSPVQLTPEQREQSFVEASATMAASITAHSDVLAQAQATARSIAKQPGKMVQQASGYGALENAVRETQGLAPFEPHLDFTNTDIRQNELHTLLRTDKLPAANPYNAPAEFTSGSFWLSRLQKLSADAQTNNWYVRYQLGLAYWDKQQFTLAKQALQDAHDMCENAWTFHALAVLALQEGHAEQAASFMVKGMLLRIGDLSYTKEALRLLVRTQEWQLIQEMVDQIPYQHAMDARVQLYHAQALHHVGEHQKAKNILTQGAGLEVPDLREGEVSIGDLWRAVHDALGEAMDEPIPHLFQFDALHQN